LLIRAQGSARVPHDPASLAHGLTNTPYFSSIKHGASAGDRFVSHDGSWLASTASGTPASCASPPGSVAASSASGSPVSAASGLPVSAASGLPVSAASGLPVSAASGLPASDASGTDESRRSSDASPESAGLPASASVPLPGSAGGAPMGMSLKSWLHPAASAAGTSRASKTDPTATERKGRRPAESVVDRAPEPSFRSFDISAPLIQGRKGRTKRRRRQGGAGGQRQYAAADARALCIPRRTSRL
jgi:hypothetical protein